MQKVLIPRGLEGVATKSPLAQSASLRAGALGERPSGLPHQKRGIKIPPNKFFRGGEGGGGGVVFFGGERMVTFLFLIWRNPNH
jgi:hypothetical protein